MAIKNFVRGSSTYVCTCCGRNTRAIGDELSSTYMDPKTKKLVGLCADCYEIAGYQNMAWDGCLDQSEYPSVISLFELVQKKSGVNVGDHYKDLAAKIGWKV